MKTTDTDSLIIPVNVIGDYPTCCGPGFSFSGANSNNLNISCNSSAGDVPYVWEYKENQKLGMPNAA